MIKLIILLVLLTILISCESNHSSRNAEIHQQGPYVIMLSIDGYRHDYNKMYSPPTLLQIQKNGASTDGLIPVFPTKTFPNHYSIATGLTAESHNLVANKFYNRSTKEIYKLSDRNAVEDGKWYGGEPIWITAKKQGMITASYFWVGSEANISNMRPDYYKKYNHSTPNEVRVDQVIDWLELPKQKRPHLILMYFSDVDSAGHKYGPKSLEVKEAVFHVDEMIKRLQKGIVKTKLPVNLVIVSDHGMSKIGPDHLIYLNDIIKKNKKIKIMGRGSHSNIYIEDKNLLEETYEKLKKAKHLDVYKRDEVPRRLSYSKSDMIGDLVISVHPPYYMFLSKGSKKIKGGTHGYDIKYSNDMNGIFYAQGPNIKPKVVSSFSNIHIYPFIAKLLNLKITHKIDGSIDVLNDLIK